jgi:hypothetical protein
MQEQIIEEKYETAVTKVRLYLQPRNLDQIVGAH